MTQSHVLGWRDGQPYSTLHQDIYFSRESGLQETRHVFLEHNRLRERWQQLIRENFTIGETGFGTGLNFLCAWQLWREMAPNGRLHFVSTEKYPLRHEELTQALTLWPELGVLSKQLLEQYRYITTGWHRLVFDQGKVTLTLLIGDARDTLPQLRTPVDAWFLDGFAPAKNPEMWQQTLFDSLARLSHSETTFATFTSAGDVRRGLRTAGFEAVKVKGFGPKREMLAGRYAGEGQPQSESDKRAIVIGGGIAGTASAHALASRGWQVMLVERHAYLAQEASGNPVAVLYPRLTGQDIALGRLALQGFLHTSRLLRRLDLAPADYDLCGLLQLAFDAREAARCEAVAARALPKELVYGVNAKEASRLAGFHLPHGGLFMPDAGWVNPVAFCNALADHPNIRRVRATATRLEPNGKLWQVLEGATLLGEAAVVILAGANETNTFPQTALLPLEPVRGQITSLAATAESRRLKAVVCTDGYVSPAVNGRHCAGATFSANDTDTELRESDDQANLAMLRRLSPELHASLQTQARGGRAALRAVTPDYLPMAGPLLDHAALSARPPRYNVDPMVLPWVDGLYVNTGHGSKGFINAPLCAEILASALNGEPAPVDAKLLAALDPNRFLLRKHGLKRLVQGLSAFPYGKMRA